jgi:hypothetical protein
MTRRVFLTALVILLLCGPLRAQCTEPVIFIDTDRFKPDGSQPVPKIRETEDFVAKIVDGNPPVVAVDVLINGTLYKPFPSSTLERSHDGRNLTFSVTVGPRKSNADIEIERGMRFITLVARTAIGPNCRSVKRILVEGGDSRLRAVIIGISKYKDISSLEYADQDARKFRDFLQRHVPRPEDELLVDLFLDEQAKRVPIEIKLQEIRENISSEGIFVLYFSGHGTLAENHHSEITAYLAPYDGRTRSEAITMLSKTRLLETYMEKASAKRRIFIFDSCFSGISLQSTTGSRQTGSIKGLPWPRSVSEQNLTNAKLRNLFDPPGLVIGLVSSAGHERSYEVSPHGGLFTHYLIESAEQLATTGSGNFTYRQLHNCARDAIRSQHPDKQQTPQMFIYPDELADHEWLGYRRE